MKILERLILSIVLIGATALVAHAGASVWGRVVADTDPGSGISSSCDVATGDGDICAEDDIQAVDDIDVGDDLTVTDDTTMGGDLALTGTLTGNTIDLGDDDPILFGAGDDTQCEYDSAQTPDSFVCGLGSDSRVFLVKEKADIAVDWAIAQQTNPTLAVASADSSAKDYISFTHDQTNAVVATNAGGIKLFPPTLTSGGTADFGLQVTQTLNDTGAAGGSDLYDALEVDITETDVTGWDTVNLLSLKVAGTSHFTVADDGTTSIGNYTTISGDTITSGGTDDYGLSIAQALNDTGAAGGSDVYRGLKINVTETDTTGWDSVYLIDAQVGGTSEFKVESNGNIESAGGTFKILGSGDGIGWTAAASANQACKTTCGGTGSCVFGYDIGTTALVDCEAATADSCICAGPAS